MSGDMAGKVIKVDGVILLQYQDRAMQIAEILSRVAAESYIAYKLVEEPIYEGDAKDELLMFYNSYNEHVQRLAKFYETAAKFIDYSFELMQYTDLELSDIIARYYKG